VCVLERKKEGSEDRFHPASVEREGKQNGEQHLIHFYGPIGLSAFLFFSYLFIYVFLKGVSFSKTQKKTTIGVLDFVLYA